MKLKTEIYKLNPRWENIWDDTNESCTIEDISKWLKIYSINQYIYTDGCVDAHDRAVKESEHSLISYMNFPLGILIKVENGI